MIRKKHPRGAPKEGRIELSVGVPRGIWIPLAGFSSLDFLKQRIELIHGEPDFTNNSSQSSFGYGVVVWDYDPSVRIARLSQNDMASPLMILLIADLPQCPNDLTAGEFEEFCQMATSTSSSAMGGGIGSSCAARLSR